MSGRHDLRGMVLSDIQTREEIGVLLWKFYTRVRQDDMLGGIFNRAIAEEEWPAHIEKLTDFWEHQLWMTGNFKGSPMRAHAQVDAAEGHQINQQHFHRWLQLWIETIEENYAGHNAERLVAQARKMSTGLFLGILQMRKRI